MAASSDAGSNFMRNGPSSAVTPSTSVNPVSKRAGEHLFASSTCVSKLQVANSDAPMIKRLKTFMRRIKARNIATGRNEGEEQAES